MPLHLSNTSECPPGGWKYFVKETGTWIPTAGPGFPHYGALAVPLGQHCRENHIPAPARAEVEDQMCHALPTGACNDELEQPVRNYNEPCNAGWAWVRQGTKTLLSWLVGGFEKVDQAEAERRASICVSCIENRHEEGCASCSAADSLGVAISKITGGSTTSRDNQLRACCICGCALKAKVWLPLDLILKNTPDAQLTAFRTRAPHCWIIQAP